MAVREKFERLRVALNDLFDLPDGRANVSGLRVWVRALRSTGLLFESLEDAIRLGLLDDLISGGSDSGAEATHRRAWPMYESLCEADRQSLAQEYTRRLQRAKRDLPHLFYVQVINVPASPADALLAARASDNELPRLNADQKAIAKAFGIPEREYARSEAAKHFSEERYEFYAERCWDFLKDAASRHSVDAVDVIYDVSSGKFYCELQQNGHARRFLLDARLVLEPLERGDRIGLDKAREAIQFAVEQALAARLGSATS